MKIFDKYADFYDSYYGDKDYKAEVAFVLSLAKQNGPKNVKTMLDIGCGTGGYIIPFAKKGIEVMGFDLSERMIEKARQKIKKNKVRANVKVADAISYRDCKKYDLVVSMFAAMGFITSNKNFASALKTARVHLNTGGLFIFDCWFGPAVLCQQPEIRVRRFTKDGLRTFRLIEPKVDPIKQIVTMTLTIFQIKGGKTNEVVVERHKMRYFFIQELRLLFETTRFKLVRVCPFMDATRLPTIKDWNICLVLKAI